LCEIKELLVAEHKISACDEILNPQDAFIIAQPFAIELTVDHLTDGRLDDG